MNSNYSNSNYDETMRYYQTAKQYYNSSNYQQSNIYLDKALNSNPPYLEIYLLKLECSLQLKDYESALKVISETLNLIKNDDYNDNGYQHQSDYKKYINQICLHMKNINRAECDYENNIHVLNQKYKKLDIDDLREFLKDIKLMLNKLQPNEKEKEAKYVWDLIQSAKTSNLFSREHTLVHIISIKWFDRWKKYTNFKKYSNEKSQYGSNEIEDNAHEYPGPIDQEDILEKSDVLIDPDEVRDYCNYAVKQGLEENQDFIIVSNATWKFLYGIYGGQDIKRYVVSINDETNQTFIEIWIKKINLLVLPSLDNTSYNKENPIKSLYLSKKETIKELKEKINRIYKNLYPKDERINKSQSKLWKLDPRVDYQEIIQKFINSRDQIVLRGKRIEESTVLEDAEIGDTDIIICEYKFDETWRFKSEQEHSQDLENTCGYCQKQSNNLSYCQCMIIKYCNYTCQKNHRPTHRDKCNLIKSEKDKTNEILKQFKINRLSKFTANSRYGITGLQNLGNTCFMNSSLQCLSNVWEMTQYFLNNDFIKDLNRENRLGTGGRLAAAYSELIKEIWHGSDSYVSPWDIKKIIGEVASQFCGFSQQDSQEFLSYMLDGLHEDLNRVKKKPFVETLESNNRPDEIVAAESWENHMKRNQSIIVDLMHGQYKSKLVCPDCQRVSITFDPYMTISLPIPLNHTNLPLYFIYKDSRKVSQKVQLNIVPTATSPEVIKQLSSLLNIDERAIELNLLKDHRVIENKTSRFDVKDFKNHEGMLFAFELYSDIIDSSTILNYLDPINIRFELIIKQELKNNDDEEISFSRVLYLNKESTLKALHLQIYFLLRGFISNYINFQKDNINPENMINLDKSDIDILENEYLELLRLPNNSNGIKENKENINDNQETSRFYTVHYERVKGLKRIRDLLPYKDDTKLCDTWELNNSHNREPIFLEILFNKAIRTDILKLNKCQEFQNSNLSRETRRFNIYECIDMFTKPELLDKDNLWYCNVCKDHKQATKTMEIYKTPKILILHLKRFRTARISSIGSFFFTSSSSKITSLVEFPIKGLDLTNYILGKCDEPPIYDLFAISNHYGGMGGGHYTAYAKNYYKDAWYDFNDSSVSKQDPKELISEAAYVLFYRRRETDTRSSKSANGHSTPYKI